MGKHAAGAHIVWDWNGTLFHDNDAVISATNAAFEEIGLEPITLERYRELYCVPIPRFYQRLMGLPPTEAEWERMDTAFQRHYTLHRTACGLADGAELLLADWRSAGRSQSILSMYGHDELVPLVREFGIESHFLRIDGRTGPSGGSKAEHMVRHLGALAGSGVAPGRTVVIGDAADDAVAALHVGMRRRALHRRVAQQGQPRRRGGADRGHSRRGRGSGAAPGGVSESAHVPWRARTVDAHVEHIVAKLGVASRREIRSRRSRESRSPVGFRRVAPGAPCVAADLVGGSAATHGAPGATGSGVRPQVTGALARSTVRNSRIHPGWSGQARDDTSVPSTTTSASRKAAPAACMSGSSAG